MQLRALALPVFLPLLIGAPVYAQATHLAVIVGLAGEPEHAELFTRWAGTLVDASSRLGVENVVYLAEKVDVDAKRVTGRSTKDEVVKAFDKLAAAGEDDVVFIVLIGHGSFDGRVAKFNLPGPDLTPADFAPLLKKMRSRHVVFVNTASASGPFIEALAGPGRTIVTAALREGKSLGVGQTHVRAAPGDAEYFDATMHAARLQRIADETGGKFYTPETMGNLVEDLKYTGRGVTTVEERDLWHMPIVLLLLVALTCAEWGYRRAVGMA